MQLYRTSVYKSQHNNNMNPKKYGEVANKLFSWALVRVISTPVFIEEASIEYFNALAWHMQSRCAGWNETETVDLQVKILLGCRDH